MFFTAYPLVVKAILEQDIYYKTYDGKNLDENRLIKRNYPYLYYVGGRNTLFNTTDFVIWCLYGAM